MEWLLKLEEVTREGGTAIVVVEDYQAQREMDATLRVALGAEQMRPGRLRLSGGQVVVASATGGELQVAGLVADLVVLRAPGRVADEAVVRAIRGDGEVIR